MQHIRQLKIQLVQAAVCVVLAALALCAATYAWYVANNTVSATTSTISATTNGFILQIATLQEGAQHGGNDKSLAFTQGSILSPASTNDLQNWYICQSWNEQGLITGYMKPSFETGADAEPGCYKVGDKKYYAFIRSDYIVYTINETGLADVYLDASEDAPITVTSSTGQTSEALTGSLRVAITTQQVGSDGHSAAGDETLRVVYAIDDETGQGNDSVGKNGWTAICDNDGKAVLDSVSYSHIFNDSYIDAPNGKNWVVKKSNDAYVVPEGSEAIASDVGYNGIVVHVYIWMEGTDSDCVNGKSIEDDPSTYNVTVNLAGVAAS